MKQGYRLMVVDKDGVLVSEFQLRESDLADPAAFVAALQQAIEDVEDEDRRRGPRSIPAVTLLSCAAQVRSPLNTRICRLPPLTVFPPEITVSPS